MNNIMTINNRDKIIDFATKLFYDKGYGNTSFETIARFCGVTKPLITYHFGTKANLAREVVQKYEYNIKNTISSKIYILNRDYNLQYSTVAEMLILNQLYKDDEKALRFYLEYLNSGFENLFTDSYSYFYKIHDRRYHLDINRESDEITMLSTAATFSALSLVYSYFTGKLNCTYEEFIDYAIRTSFRLMNIEGKRIDYILEEGKKLVNNLEYKIYPYFNVV